MEIKPLNGRYLVAGSTGLMGITSLLRLKDHPGVDVVATYHNRPPAVVADNITYKKCDCTKLSECKDATKGIDYVLMFASSPFSISNATYEDTISYFNNDTRIHINMLEASHLNDVKKYLYLSSCTIYADKDAIFSEEDMFMDEDPPECYFSVGWQSRYIETLCKIYALKFNIKKNIDISILRPTAIYGEYESFENDKSHVLPSMVKKVIDNKDRIEVWGDGKIKRDFIYSDDVFDACCLALEKVENFDIFNIGCETEYDINFLLDMILSIEHICDANIEYNLSQQSFCPSRQVSCKKARKYLGFKSKTSLEKGLKKMIFSYKSKRENK